MVGVIPGDAVMHPRPVGRGYVELQETDAMPWGGGVAGRTVRGHEFHHSSLENLDAGLRFAYRVTRGHGIDGRQDGIVMHRLLASYAHLRTGAGSDWVPRFLGFVRSVRDRGAGAGAGAGAGTGIDIGIGAGTDSDAATTQAARAEPALAE
jgi:cobyrinic acid a,c-diamide synthase